MIALSVDAIQTLFYAAGAFCLFVAFGFAVDRFWRHK